MSGALRLESASPSDAVEIATVYINSFAEDAHTTCLFPHVDWDTRIKDVARRFPAILSAPTTVYLKSLDSHDRIVAYSKWAIPEDIKDDLIHEGKITKPSVTTVEATRSDPIGLNDEFAEDFTKKLRSLKNSNVNTRRIGKIPPKILDNSEVCALISSVELSLLGTLPSYRTMGAASAHIKWGIKLSEQFRLPCLVDASPKSAPLLISHGFKEYAKLETDLQKWGGDGSYVHTCMIWKPEEMTK
jgi:hypothetical protein